MIQREIERSGIPTIGISNVRDYSEKVRPPRTLYLKWPFGHALGEPGNIFQQMTVLSRALEVLAEIEAPGEIVELSLRWKRETYTKPAWLDHDRNSSGKQAY